MSSGHEAAAQAIARRAQKEMNRDSKELELMHVMSVSPKIKVEMSTAPEVLDQDDDFKLSQFLEWWHLTYGIQKGDTLLMLRHASGQRIAFDIDSNRPVTGGVRLSDRGAGFPAASDSGLLSASSTAVPPGGGTPSITIDWNYPIIAAAQVFDADGVLIGYMPIFASLPA